MSATDPNGWTDPDRRVAAQDRLLKAMARYPREHKTGLLTPQQKRALEYASHGLKSRHIAGAMVVSVETVRTHLQHARLTLGAKTIAHACCEAIRQGLIQ